jgi:hypothetical protein
MAPLQAGDHEEIEHQDEKNGLRKDIGKTEI